MDYNKENCPSIEKLPIQQSKKPLNSNKCLQYLQSGLNQPTKENMVFYDKENDAICEESPFPQSRKPFNPKIYVVPSPSGFRSSSPLENVCGDQGCASPFTPKRSLYPKQNITCYNKENSNFVEKLPVISTFNQHNFVCSSPLANRASPLNYVHGAQGCVSPFTPKQRFSHPTKENMVFYDKENDAITKESSFPQSRIPSNPNIYVPSPSGFRPSPLNYVHGAQGCVSPFTPKQSSSSSSLPAWQIPHVTPTMQCYSDKALISNNSSTPVKQPHSFQKRHTFLTPVSTKACCPRVLNLKSNSPRSTPIRQVYNPFDCHPAQFGFPIVSPSLFNEVVSPSEKVETKFGWAIDHIAILHPAAIENSPHNQAEIPTDPEYEAKAQEAIDRYFLEVALPSPWGDSPAKQRRPLSTICNSTNMTIGQSPELMHPPVFNFGVQDTSFKKTNNRNAWTQTHITIPPVLSKEVEDVLAPFCNFTADQREQEEDDSVSLNSTSLRRKLQFPTEDLTSKKIDFDDSDEDFQSTERLTSPIQFDYDDFLPWDTTIISHQSAVRLCKACSEAELLTCIHTPALKLRSSSADTKLQALDISMISVATPKKNPIESSPKVIPCLDLSPIQKWKGMRRKSNSQIRTSMTDDDQMTEIMWSGRPSGNLTLESAYQIEMESELSDSPDSSNTLSDSDATDKGRISKKSVYSSISSSNSTITPHEVSFASMASEEDSKEFVIPSRRSLNTDMMAEWPMKMRTLNVPNTYFRDVWSDGLTPTECDSGKRNDQLETQHRQSNVMLMDIDSQGFDNEFNIDKTPSEDTGYQTLQPSGDCSTTDHRKQNEMEFLLPRFEEKLKKNFADYYF